MDGLDPIDVEIGARLRDRRVAAGLTQRDLGERMGVTFQQVQKYEGGRSRLAVSTLLRVAEILGVRAGELVGGLLGEIAESLDSLSPRERELIAAFRAAGEAQQRALLVVTKGLQLK